MNAAAPLSASAKADVLTRALGKGTLSVPGALRRQAQADSVNIRELTAPSGTSGVGTHPYFCDNLK